MTAYKRGDVVLVAFPFTDLTTTKMRPALVVSSDQIPKKITPADHLLTSQDQKHAGLPKPSMVKLGKIVTIDQRLIRKRLGRLSDPTLSFLTLKLHRLLQ